MAPFVWSTDLPPTKEESRSVLMESGAQSVTRSGLISTLLSSAVSCPWASVMPPLGLEHSMGGATDPFTWTGSSVLEMKSA